VERSFHLFIDKEGRIFYQGSEIEDPQFAFTIQRFLEKTPDGKYVAKFRGQNCDFDFEDVPYIVQDLALHKDETGRLRQVDLIFAGGYTEILDPFTLHVAPSNVLYCQVRKGEFSARFTRKSYFHLAPFIHEDENHQYYVEISNRKFRIAEHASAV
jgi:uncharacterized protein